METSAVGTPFGMVRWMLCVTALVGDLVVSRVGVTESLDELSEDGDGEGWVGHGRGGHGEM